MPQPYEKITDAELIAHNTKIVGGHKAIHASGEAHFYRGDQNEALPDIPAATGLFDRNKLVSQFSNGLTSRTYATVTPTSPYIDLMSARQINISSLLENATFEFNMYSKTFRR